MVIVQKAITYLQINAHVYTKYYVSIFFVREVRILTADRISQSCLLARRRTESTTGNSKFVSYRIHSVTYRAGVHTRETVRESRHVKHCCRGQPGIPSFYPSLKVATRVSFENCSSVEEFLGCRHFAGIRIFQSRQFSNNGSTPTDLSYLMHSRNRNQKYLSYLKMLKRDVNLFFCFSIKSTGFRFETSVCRIKDLPRLRNQRVSRNCQ